MTEPRGEWDDIFAAPLFVREYDALWNTIRSQPPAFVRPRLLAERVHVLAVREVAAVAYHSGEQTLRADLHDETGTRCASSSPAPRRLPGRSTRWPRRSGARSATSAGRCGARASSSS